MDLVDHREAIALQTLDDPRLPERPRAVELLRHDARREVFQLLVATGPRQGGVADVVVETEPTIVDPHRMVLERDPFQALPVARNQMQDARDRALESLDVDATVWGAERAGLEDLGRRDVHVHGGRLEDEEGVVLGGESRVARRPHANLHARQ